MLRLFTALVVLILTPSLHAQDYDDWYEVEVILFEHVNPAAIDAEKWPLFPGTPSMDNVIELLVPVQTIDEGDAEDEVPRPLTIADEENNSFGEALPFELLSAATFQLAEHYQALEKAEEYRPLLHLSWRQIIQGRHRPDRIHLFSGMDRAEDIPIADISSDPATGLEHQDTPFNVFSPPQRAQINEASNIQPDQQQWVLDEQGNVIDIPLTSYVMEEPLIEPPPLELDGVLTLSRGRYIHVETDFLWQLDPIMKEYAMANISEEGTEDENLDPLPQPFDTDGEIVVDEVVSAETTVEPPVAGAVRIQGKLRTRSTEIQYLDHPMVGMLILFTPYAPPLSEGEDSATSVETFAIER